MWTSVKRGVTVAIAMQRVQTQWEATPARVRMGSREMDEIVKVTLKSN